MLIAIFSVSIFSCGPSQEEQEAQDSENFLTLLFAYILLAPKPVVRFVNNSGGSESYAIRSYPCAGTVFTFPDNPVANGVTTAYRSIGAAGNFSIQYTSGGSCTTGPYNFVLNGSYTCTSGVSTITCSSP